MATWLPFKGKVKQSHSAHVDLLALDGSEGLIRIEKCNYKVEHGLVYIRLGAEVHVLQPPKNHVMFKYIGEKL